jgi:hypothetical protein
MKTHEPDNATDTLVQAQRKVERWRAAHLSHTRIPDHLWCLATDLAETHGVSRTATLLRLSYGSLKKRLNARSDQRTATEDERQTAQPAAHSPAPSPAFVEFSVGPPPETTACTIEVEAPLDGRPIGSLRLNLTGYPASEISAIVRAVWAPSPCSS